ncbi:splicing factor 3b subunit [Anaeramoeba flamelloides]|uniref:Splicing factor 3b subunit n=1 Tax=Anaeramoeba flamelloides TaxID=1746091 RepID=A0AAV7ZZP0_9EUKA|nr:splicing factor 3b subunit [Anaeramoeba flamelloides]
MSFDSINLDLLLDEDLFSLDFDNEVDFDDLTSEFFPNNDFPNTLEINIDQEWNNKLDTLTENLEKRLDINIDPLLDTTTEKFGENQKEKEKEKEKELETVLGKNETNEQENKNEKQNSLPSTSKPKPTSKYGDKVASKHRKRKLKKKKKPKKYNLRISPRNNKSQFNDNTNQNQNQNMNVSSNNNNNTTINNNNNMSFDQSSSGSSIDTRFNSIIVESGKDVFKFLTGLLWVMAGGASVRELKPYTNQIALRVGKEFYASEEEIEKFKPQLQHLLTNSRRTFTEFILEILLGVLSLSQISKIKNIKECNYDFIENEEEPPQVSIDFWNTLKGISKIKSETTNMKKKNKKKKLTKEELIENEKQVNLLNDKLQLIYEQIFTQEVIMFWFGKRFVERMSRFFEDEICKKFFKNNLFYFGKSKFMLSCLILHQELIQSNGIAKQYLKLIDLPYQNNPLNLYTNFRGKKHELIKKLIAKSGINAGKYWKVLSQEYTEQLPFKPNNIFDYFPFKDIILNPNLSNMCNTGYYSTPKTEKKRVVATKGNSPKNILSIDWIMKKN